MKLFRSIGLVLCLLMMAQSAYAHQLRPAIVSLEFSQNGSVNVKIQLNLESLVAGIGANHEDTDDAPQAKRYNALRALSSAQMEAEFNNVSNSIIEQFNLRFDDTKKVLSLVSVKIPETGDLEKPRLSELYLSASIPAGAQQVSWQYPQKFGNNVVHFYYSKTPKQKISHWLTNGTQSPAFELSEDYAPKSFSQVAKEYTVLGFEHIIPKGIDHILFVLGIFLLSVHFKPLLLQISAFTLAHTITLGLTIYGVISLSPSIVEPLIALSIAYVGIENMLVKEVKTRRVTLVFLFGLLHGMGFAGVLSELGLPESDFATALVFFNIGVEIGQLSVIAVSFLLVFWLLKNQQRYRQWVILPVSALISIIGLYWTYERIFL